jgi:hypothetical protein
MKWFVGLAALAASTSALAYPIDIENHARWLVSDSLPTYASGRTVSADIANLRTNDLIPSGRTPISAVCGTVDFLNSDDGTTSFVVYYSLDDDGRAVAVGGPYFYGPTSGGEAVESRHAAAQQFCREPGELPETEVVAAR